MHIFDSHAHIDDPRFDEDRHQLLQQIHAEGVDFIANIGCDAPTCKNSVALAEQYDFIYATVGWHPEFAGSWNAEAEGLIRSLAVHPKVRAIGETGVDYHWMNDPEEVQLKCFDDQMRIARELKMPVVIHQREGMEDCLSVVRRYPDVQGVFHCYSGSAESAKEILKMGYYLGFTGVITFKNARKLPDVVKMLPEDKFLLETDAPYLAPVPYRSKINNSAMIYLTAEKIAELRVTDTETVLKTSLNNTKALFKI